MDLQAFWDRFIHTGEPAAYLLYRGLQDGKERNGTCDDQGPRAARDRFW